MERAGREALQSCVMSAFELIAERRIEEAIADGRFDHLELSGVPVDLTEYFNLPAELRVAWTILRNANCVPVEVSLAREIDEMRRKLRSCTSEEERANLDRAIRERETGLRMMFERSAGSRRA